MPVYKRLVIGADNGGGGGSGNPPYIATFTTPSWSINGSVYEITVPEATHERGVALLVQVFELVGGVYKEVEVDVEINSAGDVKIIIPSLPDLRFSGRLNIIGE
jgi:hypothetical protein